MATGYEFDPIDCVRRTGVCQSPNVDVRHLAGVFV